MLPNPPPNPPIPARPPITPPVPQTDASKRRNAEAVTARIDEPNVIPWYHSTVLWGIIISVVLKLVWVVFKWKPPIDDAAMQDAVLQISILASFVGDAIAARGRVSSKLQPVTLFQKPEPPKTGVV